MTTAALASAALVVGLASLDRWASRSFAQPRLAAMLLAVLHLGMLVTASCTAPALSLAVARLLGLRAPPAPPPSHARFALAGAAAGLVIYLADGAAWIAASSPAAVRVLPLLVGAAVASLSGLAAGSAVRLLMWLATRNGPASAWAVRPFVTGTRSIAAALGGLVAAGIAVAAAVPLRASLLESPWLCAGIDWAGLVVALLAFAGGSRVGARIRPGPAMPWRRVGIGLAASGVLGCAAASALRPDLLPTGLLDLAHLGNLALLGVGAFLIVPAEPSLRVARGTAGVLVVGIVALVAAERSIDLRSGAPTEARPARWLLVDLATRIDFDGDGYSFLFGPDCDDFDPGRHPDAPEVPGDGIDANCRGGDRLTPLPWPRRPSFAPLPTGVSAPKRILLLVVDALRADRLSLYGYSKPTSPSLDGLARRSVVFDRAYSGSPLTRFAVPMLLTGRLVSEIRWDDQTHPPGLRSENTTIAEVLKAAGFRNAAFLTAYALGRRWGIPQGFDHVDATLSFPSSVVQHETTSARLVDRVLAWLGDHREDRSLVYAHFLDPHYRYLPHTGIPDFGGGRSGLYDGEVRFTDREIGRLLDGVRALGLDGDTAVVVVADHGEMLGEHGATKHGGALVWEEVLRVPLLIRVPGISARRVGCVTGHQDVASTILNLVGIDGADHGLTSATLVPDLVGACDADREVVSELHDVRVLVGPRYRLLFRTRTRTSQLFDTLRDPGETHDLSGSRPSLLREMQGRLSAWEEWRASRTLVDALDRAVVRRIPQGAKRIAARFPNGVELVAADLGSRRLDVDHPLRVALYLRTRGRVRDPCRVQVAFRRGKRRVRVRGDGMHEPVAGALPFPLFPDRSIVEDVFHLLFGGRSGRMTGRLALSCGGERMVALPGPNVGPRGWVDLGAIEVRGPPGAAKRRRRPR